MVTWPASRPTTIARGTFTTDPLEIALDEQYECDLDDFSFGGRTISGTRHDHCGEGTVYTHNVTVGPME